MWCTHRWSPSLLFLLVDWFFFSSLFSVNFILWRTYLRCCYFAARHLFTWEDEIMSVSDGELIYKKIMFLMMIRFICLGLSSSQSWHGPISVPHMMSILLIIPRIKWESEIKTAQHSKQLFPEPQHFICPCGAIRAIVEQKKNIFNTKTRKRKSSDACASWINRTSLNWNDELQTI